MTSQKPSFLLGSGGDLLAKNYIDTFSEVKKLPKQFVAGGWPSQIDFDTFYFAGGGAKKVKKLPSCVKGGGVIWAVPKRNGVFFWDVKNKQ